MIIRAFAVVMLLALAAQAQKPQFSGIYPHLAYFNNEGECGTGAVVPFADRLWVITYGPHLPKGSSDKLYEITSDLAMTIRPESIGGTPANRMIHRESNQLFIGPYAIDKDRNVRVIPYTAMPGRHTANMRHLTDPASKIYFATMEEGFYEVDVKTLDVKMLYPDANSDPSGHGGKLLPGYHGKGAYTAQGRVVYANNGETSPEARKRPDVPSGCLAEWDGKDWKVIRRNQFTEVTGPGGIHGAEKDSDVLWSIGWDHRSLILMVLDGGKWHQYRLPKGSHSYDGAHGWNTEWPRIREIGEADLLMTMHGTFWRFPKTFSATNAAGIRPRSNYIKVIGDFARWGDRVVFGCDDTAKSEFLNKRKAKGVLTGAGQSQSNLWFVAPDAIDKLGPTLGRGAVWVKEDVKANTWSDKFLIAGYKKRGVHISVEGKAKYWMETDDGKGRGRILCQKEVDGYTWMELPDDLEDEWIRVIFPEGAKNATVQFVFANNDPRTEQADPIFNGIATASDTTVTGGLARARGENLRTLQFAAMTIDRKTASDIANYELGEDMKLQRVDNAQSHEWLKKNAAIPVGVLSVDPASVLFIDDSGKRWRLPKGDPALDAVATNGLTRIDREVATERDLFNAHGTFYELPAENAGGFAKVRPIATHNRRVHDYCSYRGLLVITGISGGENNPHIIRSDDGKAALWAGAVDDLWKLGKPRGAGGPWKDSAVKANEPSDPYLLTAYDQKRMTISADKDVAIRVEVDLTGDGNWVMYRRFDVAAGAKVAHEFPDAFGAYWVRAVAEKDCTVSVMLEYR